MKNSREPELAGAFEGFRVLEIQLRAQLNDTCCDALDTTAHRSESSAANVAVHRAWIRIVVVKQVEDFRTELKVAGFREVESPVHAEILVDDSGQSERSRARRRA